MRRVRRQRRRCAGPQDSGGQVAHDRAGLRIDDRHFDIRQRVQLERHRALPGLRVEGQRGFLDPVKRFGRRGWGGPNSGNRDCDSCSSGRRNSGSQRHDAPPGRSFHHFSSLHSPEIGSGD